MTSSFRSVLATSLALDRGQIATGPAIRCAVGVGVPLVAGVAAGHAGHGVAAAAGALVVGFATFQGTYRTRAQVVLLSCLGVAVSTFVGAVAGQWLVSAVAVVALWGFLSGLMVVLGQSASVVGLLSVMALLLVAEFPATPAQALTRTALVLAGGLFQALLVVSLWPLQRFGAERRVLATAYRSVADYAVSIPAGGAELPDPTTLPAVRTTLADPQPFSRHGETLVFRGMLDVAERMRTELAGLARTRERLAHAPEARQALDDLLVTASAALAVVAAGLDAAQPPDELSAARERARAATARLEDLAGDDEAIGAALHGAQALLGQLRAVIRLAIEPSGAEKPASEQPERERMFADALTTILANLSLDSAACRHAIRLAVALAIGTAIYRAVPLERGYWLPLTTLVVLRPDFSATFTRGLSRVAGTVLGAGLATVITVLLHPGPALLSVLVVVLAWSTYAFFQANYAAFSLSVTALVVFLLAFVGLPEDDAVALRLVATLAGGAIALVAFAAWPTWERRFVSERLAELLERQAAYGKAVLDAYAGSDGDRQGLLDAARLARSNAEASVERWLDEPARSGVVEPVTAVGVLAAVQRYAHAVLALDAHLPRRDATAAPARALSDAVEDTLLRHAATLRGERPESPSTLRDLQLPLAAGAGGVTAALLAAETDRMVDAVNTVGYLLDGRDDDPDV